MFEQQLQHKLAFLCRDYHWRAKFSDMHERIWITAQRKLLTVNNHIVFFLFFFTVYHILLDPVASVDGTGQPNSIALLIMADGDVSLCSSVQDYGKCIVINVL